jgi:hypothetical protein
MLILVSWVSWYNTQFWLMFLISEDWTSCYIIIENENDFMENLYDHGLFFWCYKFKKKVKNILIFKHYASLIVISNVDQPEAQIWSKEPSLLIFSLLCDIGVST